MAMTDLTIAKEAAIRPIQEIAQQAGIAEDALELYGKYKAKIDVNKLPKTTKDGKVVLVTAISPTPAGEGKSTVTVGLADALKQSGESVMVALREPSLGPVMGVKGGATGGGFAQVLPMEDINLHFTGDIHAITSANNALAALIDNHLHQGNALRIDPRRITWKRALDMNDRALRHVTIGLGGPAQGVPREDGFDITVASEIMAVLCLATSREDLKERLARMVIGYTYDREPITVRDLEAQGALALLLKEAFKPNLVQTIEGTPAIIHGGPFANIAHGCNSLMATNTARSLADVVVTEAGFGADLGAEKFMHIKSRKGGFHPDAVVIVATVRALKMHGGVDKKELGAEDADAVRRGIVNLAKHVETIRQFGVEPVVALNRFTGDSDAELAQVMDWAKAEEVAIALTEVWGKGGAGGLELAELVKRQLDNGADFTYLYAEEDAVEEKLRTIVQKVYGGADVQLTDKAQKQLAELKKYGWDALPICMAKTQYSLSDQPKLLGRPEGFTVTIRELIPKLGAGFIVCLTGDIMTMPGLPKSPAALNMDVAEDGQALGLF
ncbi:MULTISPECIES: formate--tetrahydrofolate ligase [unclassified Planococcus (in: firmicutes)]|uniref:formate--tetrahydrofolate ligase n=1 Tax=Planococcus TaxID=1372 RepID=UPI000C34E785|nr:MULTISPECIES: formate--tetrahydrofolate ligase [unclassified Planococcus (in: firmicutes)]AUD12764.1 formate--tetrahydrofolate ligase [Planococcus sp. MB-3u-03]PKG46707.1 formate--tetrahydrofolate ligase [Planococcus sp. Urea-trap-24]PKG89552.1 formate--tetrahydrofolate ligase [Planococcus sp. Urea-3u-39]PKH36139.1 formate--tetrahydrofolate ligase [Planococcus sp. MB-3u-09]